MEVKKKAPVIGEQRVTPIIRVGNLTSHTHMLLGLAVLLLVMLSTMTIYTAVDGYVLEYQNAKDKSTYSVNIYISFAGVLFFAPYLLK